MLDTRSFIDQNNKVQTKKKKKIQIARLESAASSQRTKSRICVHVSPQSSKSIINNVSQSPT